MSNAKSFYEQQLESWLCVKTDLPPELPRVGECYRMDDKIGSGRYWIFYSLKGYSIKIHDFYFKEDTLFEIAVPECLSISWYDSIAGEQFSPYEQLRSCVIKSYLGGREPFTAFIHKDIPIKSISIEYELKYYEQYLSLWGQEKCENPVEVFNRIGQTSDFPEMKQLLMQVRDFRGSPVSTKLYFDAKAAEALSLIYRRSEMLSKASEAVLCQSDVAALENIAKYIDNHYLEPLRINELARIAAMGPTKLKKTFKAHFNSTIAAYITRVRVEKAEHLLALTDLPIAAVTKAVGYANPGYFDQVFSKEKGILPTEFRKTIMNNRKA